MGRRAGAPEDMKHTAHHSSHTHGAAPCLPPRSSVRRKKAGGRGESQKQRPTRTPSRWLLGLHLGADASAPGRAGSCFKKCPSITPPQTPLSTSRPPAKPSQDPVALPVLAALLPNLLQFKDRVGADGAVPGQAGAHGSHGDDPGQGQGREGRTEKPQHPNPSPTPHAPPARGGFPPRGLKAEGSEQPRA